MATLSSFSYTLVLIINNVQGSPIYAETLKVCETNAKIIVEALKKDGNQHSTIKTVCLPLFEAKSREQQPTTAPKEINISKQPIVALLSKPNTMVK
jgi:hypothetical protein